MTAPAPTWRTTRPSCSTSSRPAVTTYTSSAGSPAANSSVPAATSTFSASASSRARTSSGRRESSGAAPSALVGAATGAAGSGIERAGGRTESSSASSWVRGTTLPMNSATTAVRAKQMEEKIQPWRRLSTVEVGDGVPTMTTRIAMPSTAPICRALEFTADAVANRPPGTAASAALPSTGRVAPTPMPLSTWPGSHAPQKSGVTSTRATYQTYASAQMIAPGMITSR